MCPRRLRPALLRTHAALATATLLVGVLSGCAFIRPDSPLSSTSSSTGSGLGSDGPAAATSGAEPVEAGTRTPLTAEGGLAALPVKGRAPRTGYTRAQFGQAWADVDRNGCDTRNDILRRDLTALMIKPGTHGCKVLTGSLPDPYSAQTVRLAEVQIDHVVALSDAWQTGAQQLSPERRIALANDPLNLQATVGGLNQAKSDSDAASWLPPAKSYRCEYVARQVAVKRAYQLWVTPAEHSAIAGILASCPGEPLPTARPVPAPLPQAPAAPPTTAREPTAPATPTAAAAPPSGASGQCDPAYPGVCIPPVAVAGDLDCGDIDYRRFVVLPPDPHHFDSDGDGIGCESG